MVTAVLACPVCDHEGEPPLVERSGPFSLYLCPSCEVVFCHPLTNPGSPWYEEDLETRVRMMVASGRAPEQMLREPHRRFLRDLPARGGSLLDVGCAEGGFLAVAQRWYTVAGLDFNRNAIELARERYGLRHAYAMTLEEFRAAMAELDLPSAFDVATVFDVLEHVESPAALLRSLRDLLAPGAWLAINVPNRDRRPNLHEEWDRPPHHLTRWNRRALARLLEGTGFKPVLLEEFTDLGYLTIDWIDRSGPARAFKRLLVAGAPAAGTNGASTRARLAGLLGKARLWTARTVELPLYLALRGLRAPGQMLYCLARADEPSKEGAA